jgi:hypothetical protein
MHFVSPSVKDIERFYLRMLLLYRKGCTSYESLRTIDSNIYDTFQQACLILGLIDDDKEWDTILTLATQTTTYIPQLRNLFSLILINCTPVKPCELWNNHKDALAQDILYNKKVKFNNNNLGYTQEIYDKALYEIDCILNKNGRSLSDYRSMPTYKIDQATFDIMLTK